MVCWEISYCSGRNTDKDGTMQDTQCSGIFISRPFLTSFFKCWHYSCSSYVGMIGGIQEMCSETRHDHAMPWITIVVVHPMLEWLVAYRSMNSYCSCSSYVGMIGGVQEMSLVPRCVQRHGTIMHEFLHALGFYHEQSRGDRDQYVFVNFANIQKGNTSKSSRFKYYKLWIISPPRK